MNIEEKRYRSFPLRLPPSLRKQSAEFAQGEGMSLNHFISMAVAEKIGRMEQTRAQVQAQQEASARSGLAIVPVRSA